MKSRLPRELQGLMGEANLKFARGEYEEVMMMCQEVIKSGNRLQKQSQLCNIIFIHKVCGVRKDGIEDYLRILLFLIQVTLETAKVLFTTASNLVLK